ncbi:MAG TPA: hypothetical protein VG755_30385 [Nannocystaceae bacterium]|nr:hypothetical protein [Nannocystaceae bacterium]
MIRTAGDALFYCAVVALPTFGVVACGDDTAGATADSSSSGEESGDASATLSSTTVATMTSADSTGSDTDTTMCAEAEIGQTLPTEIVTSTLTETDEMQGSCGGAGAPDIAFTFTAATAGLYTFDTVGSTLDTVLYILDGECSDTELACANDPATTFSILVLELAAGQTVTLVVDGTTEAGTDARLRIHSGDLGCPAGDLGSTVPATASGSLSDYFDLVQSMCGGFGTPDATYLFTAPADDTYVIDAIGSSFDPIITLLSGGCGGNQIACAPQGLVAELDAGQTVGIVVDTSFMLGSYELHVSTLGGACPDSDLGSTVPQSIDGDLSDADNTTAGSCGGALLLDDTYSFTAAMDGIYRFDTIGSAIDTVMHVHADSCDGEELRCNDNIDFEEIDSAVSIPIVGGNEVLVAIEGMTNGAYQLAVDQLPCPDGPLDATVPNTELVTSLGNADRLRGSCVDGFSQDSADYVFTFVAPHDGTFVFDTEGTGFTTVIYALAGTTCVGEELGCGYNNEGFLTALALTLDAGEEINLVVDATQGVGGAIQLNVNELIGTCPDETLMGPFPINVSGTTVGAENASAGQCGGALNGDVSYEFTAPLDGFHLFDTEGSAFDAILYVRDGACDGAELNCVHSMTAGGSRVGATLDAGQTVVVTVDGTSEGAFDLTVTAPTCPEGDLGNEFPVSYEGTTAISFDKLDFDVSCAIFDDGAAEYTMRWTAPADGTYVFDTVGSEVSSAVTILDAACEGATLGCASSFTNANVELDAGQEVIIAVTPEAMVDGMFTLNIN